MTLICVVHEWLSFEDPLEDNPISVNNQKMPHTEKSILITYMSRVVLDVLLISMRSGIT